MYIQDDSFGDVREFFVGMLEMYHYEETLMNASCLAFRNDVHQRLGNLQRVSKKGVSSQNSNVTCDLCRKHLALQGGHCISFQCGHKYHLSCLQMAGCVSIITDNYTKVGNKCKYQISQVTINFRIHFTLHLIFHFKF